MAKSSSKRRPYRLKARAERQEATRRRITAAAIRLHEEIGPNATTVSEIARHAGVERPTVYRHFPDELSLLRACQQHWLATNPPPDGRLWAAISDPLLRLNTALGQLYGFYRRGSPMIDNLFRDAPRSAALREVLAGVLGELEAGADLLAGAIAGSSGRRATRIAVGHAIAFETWRSLTRPGGLTDHQAADLMTTFVAVAGGVPGTDRSRQDV